MPAAGRRKKFIESFEVDRDQPLSEVLAVALRLLGCISRTILEATVDDQPDAPMRTNTGVGSGYAASAVVGDRSCLLGRDKHTGAGRWPCALPEGDEAGCASPVVAGLGGTG